MTRNVKGVLFADYVRMIRHHKIRHHKGVDWDRCLLPEDVRYLQASIGPDQWYPMAAFERLGDAILREIARGDLEAVRMWGRFTADQLHAVPPQVVVPGDPVETLRRFHALRGVFFDFEAIEIGTLLGSEAQISIHYRMGPTAEEAASHQTMGFFERLLELAGAERIYAQFLQRSWTGDPETLLDLSWRMATPPPTS